MAHVSNKSMFKPDQFGEMDRKYTSWRIKNPRLVAVVIRQYHVVCWSVALTRQLEALLKRLGLLDYGCSFSIQELINLVPFDRRGLNGYMLNILDAQPLLEGI